MDQGHRHRRHHAQPGHYDPASSLCAPQARPGRQRERALAIGFADLTLVRFTNGDWRITLGKIGSIPASIVTTSEQVTLGRRSSTPRNELRSSVHALSAPPSRRGAPPYRVRPSAARRGGGAGCFNPFNPHELVPASPLRHGAGQPGERAAAAPVVVANNRAIAEYRELFTARSPLLPSRRSILVGMHTRATSGRGKTSWRAPLTSSRSGHPSEPAATASTLTLDNQSQAPPRPASQQERSNAQEHPYQRLARRSCIWPTRSH